jgi:hypothetical protein
LSDGTENPGEDEWLDEFLFRKELNTIRFFVGDFRNYPWIDKEFQKEKTLLLIEDEAVRAQAVERHKRAFGKSLEATNLFERLLDKLFQKYTATNPDIDIEMAALTAVCFAAGRLRGLAESLDELERLRAAEHARKVRATAEQTDQARRQAIEARRQLGEPTRQAAREMMARRPHLSLNACASAIAAGRDISGVRRMIEELFPKGPDGKRRYMAHDPAE